MTSFWIITVLLLLVAAAFILWPLWRTQQSGNEVVRDAANLEIMRDQLAEMQADFDNGLLTPEAFEQGKRELEARVLEEVKEPQAAAHGLRNPHRQLAIVLVAILPLLAVGLYYQIGNPKAIGFVEPMSGVGEMGTVHGQGAIDKLEKRIADNPQDIDALVVLARSYTELERYADAARTYDKATKLVPTEAILWADYADALAMAHGQLAGAPTKLLDKALALEPDNMKALALAGSAAMERGDYPAAIRHWERLLKQLPPESQDAQMIHEGLRQAQEFDAHLKGGKPPRMADNKENLPQIMPQAGGGGQERISGTVVLSDAMKSKVEPGDTLFILARAAQGPKMPLAILRKQASDLPLKFELDDSMAMAPEMKLSAFDQVVVVARISKSGNAMPQAGDLQGVSGIVKPGSSGIRVVIDQPAK